MIYRVRQLETADALPAPEGSVLRAQVRVDVPEGDYERGARLHNAQVLSQEQVEVGELYEFTSQQFIRGKRREVRESVRIVPRGAVEERWVEE